MISMAEAEQGGHSRAVLFGDHLAAAADAAPAEWLRARPDHFHLGAVRSLVPARYDSYLLVVAAPEGDLWWERQNELLAVMAEVLGGFTTTPDTVWFAIWEGHGFTGGQTFIAWRHDAEPTPEQRAEVAARQRALREEDARREARVAAALADLPTFSLPHRRYYLLRGPTGAAGEVRWPNRPEDRFRPDLWWPDDRAWFVGTDVDLWCTYVGGTEEATTALIARLPGRCRLVSLDEPLQADD